jgi:Lipid A 3-O-deacylase (PagL)
MTHFPWEKSCHWNAAILLMVPLCVVLGGAKPSRAQIDEQTSSSTVEASHAAQAVPLAVKSTEMTAAAADSLPDAPAPADNPAEVTAESSSSGTDAFRLSSPFGSVVSARSPAYVSPDQCPSDETRARSCRVHWHQLLISTAFFNAFQNTGNLYTGYWYRWETTHGVWFQRWINSAAGWRWDVWSDQNPVLDQYVGHPMMGAITNYLWIQNDPKGMTVDFANPREYWNSRLRALAFSTAYSFEWKLGPFGEAGIGHNGDHPVPQAGVPPNKWTNETGWVELVTTPVGGLLWTVAEDALDKHVVAKIEEKPRGPLPLLLLSFLTPARATANIFRFRAPWYRDGRPVPSNSPWSDPGGESNPTAESSGEPAHGAAAISTSRREGASLPVWPHYGGVHEFGAWWGLSLISGHIWGYAKDVKYMPIDVSYSYLIVPGTKWNFRYAPEMTAIAMLDEPNPAPVDRFTQRKRSYGSGASPVGFRASFYPESRVQPFLSTNGGFLYFDDRVLSPQGSQFMYTIDFGGGIQVFRKSRQAWTLGYRYQHLSNANISHHNPGADANTFYLAVSRFRTKHYR